MEIAQIYVATCRQDFHLTRLCIASIRYWYPEIPIALIKDEGLGDFDLTELERAWHVQRFPTAIKHFGYGYSKLEPLFLPERRPYLMLDSDLLFLGPVLDQFRSLQADFVVDPERMGPTHLETFAYRLEPLARFDPLFQPPDFIFNAGQYVATSGLLTRNDFAAVLEWTEPRQLRQPAIFQCGDQGIINYVIFKNWLAGRLSLEEQHFYLYAGLDSSTVTLPQLRHKKSRPQIIHWPGPKPTDINQMKRADLLRFYQDFYQWHTQTRLAL
jgi:lipopolysaccharide biosynthesis glycosyltransferase